MSSNINYYNQRFPESEKVRFSHPVLPRDQENAILKKILDPSDTQPIDQKQFALMFGDTFIEGTALEGGNAEVNAKYYLQELEKWEQDPHFADITAEQLGSIKRDIQCFLVVSTLITLNQKNQLKNFISNGLKQQGRVVVPMLVNGMQGIPGHVFSCVFQRSPDGILSFYFLNKGEGSGNHPEIKQSELGKSYRSYQSTAYVISDPHFFESEGDSDLFVQRIIDYANGSPTLQSLKLFDSDYLYQDLALFADKELTKKQLIRDQASIFKNDDLGVTPQRSGTCPEQTIRLIIRDNLLKGGASRESVRRTMFSNKMRGLKNGFHSLRLDDTPEGLINTKLMKKSAEGMAVQAAKMHQEGLIPLERMNEALVLVEQVLKKVTEAEIQQTHPVDLEGLQNYTVSDVRIPEEESLVLLSKKYKADKHFFPDYSLQLNQLVESCLEDPNQILVTLKTIEKFKFGMERGLRSFGFDEFVHPESLLRGAISLFLLRLPVPKAEGETYWNRVNDAERHALIKELYTHINYLYPHSSEHNYIRMLVRKQVCAITHRVLCEDPQMGEILKRYAVNPTFAGPHFFEDRFQFLHYYPNGKWDDLNHEIDRYFSSTESLEEPQFIFCAWDVKDVRSGIKLFLSEGRLHINWIHTLNLYKACIETLGLDSDSPVDLYIDCLCGNGENPLFHSLFLLNNLVQGTRVNCRGVKCLIVQNPSQEGLVTFGLGTAPDWGNYPIPELETKINKELTAACTVDEKERENATLEGALTVQGLNPEAMESLWRLRNFDGTRVPLWIDWCLKHAELLQLKEVQQFLETALLKGEVVQQAEKTEPATITQLRDFLDERIEFNRGNTDGFLFWILLSVHVESRLTQVHPSVALDRIKKIQALLAVMIQDFMLSDNDLAYKFAYYNDYIYSLFPELAERDPQAFILLQCNILVTMAKDHSLMYDTFPEWVDATVYQKHMLCLSLFEGKPMQVAPVFLNGYLELPADTMWEIDYPYARFGDYCVDLLRLIILKNNINLHSYEGIKSSRWTKSFEKFSAHLIPQGVPVKRSKSVVEALDGSFRFELKMHEGRSAFFYEFDHLGVREKFYSFETADYFKNPEQRSKHIGSDDMQWKSLAYPNRMLIVDAKSLKATGIITYEAGFITLERMVNGRPTGEFQIPLEQNPNNKFLSQITSQGNLKVFCKMNSLNKWQVSTLIFDPFEFHLEDAKGHQRFKSKEYPHYFLAADQWQAGLLSEGAVWFENAKKTHGMAVVTERSLDSEFQLQLQIDLQAKQSTLNPKAPFVFDLDSKREKLIGRTNAASLYLVRLYLRQERYLEAFDALKSVEFKAAPNKSETWLFDAIQNLDQGPAATAIKLHARILYLSSRDKVIPTPSVILEWLRKKEEEDLKKLVNRYIQFTSSLELQRIPEPLRVNPTIIKKLIGDSGLAPFTPFSEEDAIYNRLSEFISKPDESEDKWKDPDFLSGTRKRLSPKLLQKDLSELAPILQEGQFSLSALPEYLERCEKEPSPGMIDLNIYALDRRSRDLHIKLFPFIWLYRKTKDEKLKKLLIDFFIEDRYSDKALIQRSEELLKALPVPESYSRDQPPQMRSFMPSAQMDRVQLKPESSLRTSPFKEAVAEYCVKSEKPRLPEAVSPLESVDFVSSDRLGMQLVDDLKEAHQRNLADTFTFYSPQTNLEESAKALESLSKQKAEDLLKESRALLHEIDRIANFPSETQFSQMSPKMQADVVSYRLKQKGLQSTVLTFRDPLFEALLTRDRTIIREKNPFLTDENIDDLHVKMLKYIDLMNLKTQAVSARTQLRKARKTGDAALFSKAVSLLQHDRLYDLHRCPELAIYEYATGFQLRPQQVELLNKIIGLSISGNDPELLQQLCFEFQAGGGKTKVISAILAARIHAEGKAPVFFSVPHLEDVTQEDLKEAMGLVFERRLTKISFTIKDKIDLSHVLGVITAFENALKEKRTLFMTPETWHALDLARTHSITSGNKELEQALDHLFYLLKEKAVALIDEGQLNVEALHETNRAIGKPHHIPPREQKLFAWVGRILMQDEELREIVHLAQNKQATMLVSDLPIVQKRLALLLSKGFKSEITKENRRTLREYWLDPDSERPDWLLSLCKSAQENLSDALLVKRIDLVRGIINTVLPFTLNMTYDLDYQRPQEVATEVLIPAKQGFASKSHFQNPDVAALVTCQGTFQSGLTVRQLEILLEKFTKSYEADLKQGADSVTAARWKRIQEESGIAPSAVFTLAQYQQSNADERKKLLEKCHQQVSKHVDLVEEYLLDEILPKIAIYPSVEQSTATNLAESFGTRIVFSATLGIHEKYPIQEHPETSHLRDLEFMDQVMTRAVLPQNSSMLWKLETTTSGLLEDIPLEEFSQIEGLINVGSFCDKASSEDWADAFLKLAEIRGVNKKAALFFKDHSLYLKIAGAPPETHAISGSNLTAVFASFGLEVEQVYKIYGPSETTGTDFPLSSNARMLLTIGEHVNLSLSVQSIMRMRGFLNDPIDPASSQKILWLGTAEYHKKIQERFPETEIVPAHFFAYALEKEIESDQAAIMQQARQEVEAIIVDEVRERRRGGRWNSQYMKAFERSLSRDPSALYGGSNRELATFESIMDHARGFSESVGIPIEEYAQSKLKKLEKIAKRAENLVEKTQKRTGSNLKSTMEQTIQVEQRQEQKQEQRAKVDIAVDRKVFSERKHPQSLFAGPILEVFGDALRSPHQIVNPIFSTDLFFFENAFSLNPEDADQPHEIKRTELFLVEVIEGVKRAFALSGYDADTFLNEMNNTASGNRGKKVGLFTASGRLVRNGPKGARFLKKDLQSLTESAWMKDKLCEIGFWNGEVTDKAWMEEKLNPDNPDLRESYITTWAWICDKHANPSQLQTHTMKNLIEKTGYEAVGNQEELSRAADILDVREYPDLARLAPEVPTPVIEEVIELPTVQSDSDADDKLDSESVEVVESEANATMPALEEVNVLPPAAGDSESDDDQFESFSDEAMDMESPKVVEPEPIQAPPVPSPKPEVVKPQKPFFSLDTVKKWWNRRK